MGHSTKQQHYIPQMILKRFYADGYTLDREFNGEKFLWLYDKEKNIERKVDNVKQICKEKNLYEFKDRNGNIVNVNMIEKSLSNHETQWDIIFNKIEKKDFEISNLSKFEINELYIFATLQLLRMPMIIDKGTEILEKYTQKKISRHECRSVILSGSLLDNNINLFNTDMPNFLFTGFLKILKEKELIILKSIKPLMLNTSCPIISLNDETENGMLPDLVYPISKNSMICLYDHDKNYNDRFTDENFADSLNIAAITTGRFIVIAKPFSMIGMKLIESYLNFSEKLNTRNICQQILEKRVDLIINKNNINNKYFSELKYEAY